MKQMETLLRGNQIREQMAYYRIVNGLTMKECAGLLNLNLKTAEYYWQEVKRQIRGQPCRSCAKFIP